MTNIQNGQKIQKMTYAKISHSSEINVCMKIFHKHIYFHSIRFVSNPLPLPETPYNFGLIRLFFRSIKIMLGIGLKNKLK